MSANRPAGQTPCNDNRVVVRTSAGGKVLSGGGREGREGEG